jgi:hypothetical protein
MAVTARAEQCVTCLSRDLEVLGRMEGDEYCPEVEIYKCRTCRDEFDTSHEALRGWPYRRHWMVQKFAREEDQTWADTEWYVAPPIGYNGKYRDEDASFKNYEEAVRFAFQIVYSVEGLSRG